MDVMSLVSAVLGFAGAVIGSWFAPRWIALRAERKAIVARLVPQLRVTVSNPKPLRFPMDRMDLRGLIETVGPLTSRRLRAAYAECETAWSEGEEINSLGEHLFTNPSAARHAAAALLAIIEEL